MTLKTRPPSGRVAPPLILLEGGEKSGKTWSAAELSASGKVGRTFWIDLGEGAADEYGAIPGVRYEIVEHDGTWHSLLSNVLEIREEAARASAAGEPPVVLVIDSMTQEWDLLKDWASSRARKAEFNQKRLRADPNAEIDISMNFWNDAGSRHRSLMTKLMTFPGIVVMIARGKETAAVDSNGKPIPRRKDYSVEGQKNLAYDASAWVRLSRTDKPLLVGLRSVHGGMKPGVDKPETAADFTLEWLIFDRLKYDPQNTQVRDLAVPPDPELIREEALAKDATIEGLKALWHRAKNADLHDEPVMDNDGRTTTLKQLIEDRAAALAPKPAPEQAAS
jgi:hypothetical protein